MLLVLLLLTAGAFVLYGQWTAVPSHVAAIRAWVASTPVAQRDQLARQLEMRLPTNYTQRITPGTDGLRTLEATFEEINAWLGIRLEQYLANQGVQLPDGIGAIMVASRDHQLVLAADVDLPKLRQIVSIYFTLLPPEDLPQDADATGEPPRGQAADPPSPWSVQVTRITAGNVPLPTGKLIDIVREQLDEKTLARPAVADLLDALEQGQAIPLPTLKVDKTRQAWVQDFALDETTVRATLRVFRQDAPPPTSPHPPGAAATGNAAE